MKICLCRHVYPHSIMHWCKGSYYKSVHVGSNGFVHGFVFGSSPVHICIYIYIYIHVCTCIVFPNDLQTKCYDSKNTVSGLHFVGAGDVPKVSHKVAHRLSAQSTPGIILVPFDPIRHPPLLSRSSRVRDVTAAKQHKLDN